MRDKVARSIGASECPCPHHVRAVRLYALAHATATMASTGDPATALSTTGRIV